MRILTVRQPWAHAIIHGGKDVENRVRNIAGDYRGPVAIHVAQADAGRQAYEAVDALAPHAIEDGARNDIRGAIIGVVDLVDVHFSGECWGFNGDGERWCSRWAEHGTHHLVLANPRALSEPIPYKGALGLRRLDDDMTARIEAAIA